MAKGVNKGVESGGLALAGVHIRNRLVSGLLILIPLVVTFYILNLLFGALTGFVKPLLKPWLGELSPTVLNLISLVITVTAIYLVGMITTMLIGRRLLQFGESIMMRVPIVKTIYAAVKQIVDAVSATGKNSFEAVVAIEYPRRDAWTIGFVTGSILNPEGQRMLAVFVPTTPNPTSGFMILFLEKEVHYTDIAVEDGLKMIVSGGMLTPGSFGRKTPGSQRRDAAAGAAPSAADAAAGQGGVS